MHARLSPVCTAGIKADLEDHWGVRRVRANSVWLGSSTGLQNVRRARVRQSAARVRDVTNEARLCCSHEGKKRIFDPQPTPCYDRCYQLLLQNSLIPAAAAKFSLRFRTSQACQRRAPRRAPGRSPTSRLATRSPLRPRSAACRGPNPARDRKVQLRDRRVASSIAIRVASRRLRKNLRFTDTSTLEVADAPAR